MADGYSMEELPQIGVKQSEIQDFLGMLDKCNLSVENAKAINQYSNGSNMILSVKKGTAGKEEIQSGINKEMFEKLQLRGMSEKQISEVQKFIETLDLDRPVHDNFTLVNEYVNQMNIPRNCYSPICTAVSGIDKQEPSISSEKHIGQQQDESSIDNPNMQNNLPATQGRFSRLFNQMRARFSRNNKVDNNVRNTDYKPTQSKSKVQEKKSWKLEPEEKARIQKETAEIAKRHREQQEKQKQEPQQEFGQNQENIQQTQQVAQEGQERNQEQTPIPPPQPMMDRGGMEL